jgi:hypothetical protein
MTGPVYGRESEYAVQGTAAATTPELQKSSNREPADAQIYDDPAVAGLLNEVAARMGDVSKRDAVHRSLRTMLALYDAKAVGGTPVIRYKDTEQQVNLPGGPS